LSATELDLAQFRKEAAEPLEDKLIGKEVLARDPSRKSRRAALRAGRCEVSA